MPSDLPQDTTRAAVPDDLWSGVAIRCADGNLCERARRAGAKPASNDPATMVFIGPGWRSRLTEFAEMLSHRELRMIRGVEIDAAGHDPWLAQPLAHVLMRLETPWLPEALASTRITCCLQPIVDLRTERVYGYEALVRADESTGCVGGGAVIAAARAHRAAAEFDRLARHHAIASAAPQLMPDESLFINFLAAGLTDPEAALAETWEVAREHGINTGRLVFELVENDTAPDLRHAKSVFDVMRAHGARVALDDLGGGGVTLASITQLWPDIVKLDRSLLPQDPTPADRSLYVGLVSSAVGRGMLVVAEGVETERQAQFVYEAGAPLAQGYYFGKPAPETNRSWSGFARV